MRGVNDPPTYMFSYISPEQRVPSDYPLRLIKAEVDKALCSLSLTFEAMYSKMGQPSIPPERLLKAQFLTVDGSRIEAWASLKSFRPKLEDLSDRPTTDDDKGNPNVNFRGERRKNDTHYSTTDPEAFLVRKVKGKKAKFSYNAHALMENRNGLLVDIKLTRATGKAEREAQSRYLPNSKSKE